LNKNLVKGNLMKSYY